MTPIQITPQAQQQLNSILKDHALSHIKVHINNKGCSGHSYVWSMVCESDVHPLDHVIQLDAGTFVVDHGSMLKLWGSTLDYKIEPMSAQFVWHNPHVKHTCGCGESVGF